MKYVLRGGRWVDPQTGEPMELPDGPIATPMIISDLPAYMSPLGTGLIDGRAARREDLKRSGCREVDPDEWRPNEKFIEKEARKAREGGHDNERRQRKQKAREQAKTN